LQETPSALRWFAASPVIAVQLIGCYFSKLGEAKVRYYLTLKQELFLNSISIHTTKFFGIFECGCLPIADVLSHY
jgi:hypothetical protein